MEADLKWWADVERTRKFAQKLGVARENVYDVGRHGLSHQVPAEEGWVLPGTFYLGADTQGRHDGCAELLRDGRTLFDVPGIGDS